ncbi:MAG: SAM-dependent methyltransferase [Actinomycetota bacterium]
MSGGHRAAEWLGFAAVTSHHRTRASWTARAVALGRAVGRGDLYDGLAERALPRLVRPAVRGLRAAAALPGGRAAVAVGLGGLNVHAALRMHAVDAEVERAVLAGIRQVVVVGAGYDSRAWRLEALRGATVVEVDRPATQRRKRAAMADLTPLADVQFVAADLAEDSLLLALAPTSWDRQRPTLWVWEAVVPYLDDTAVRSTATGLAELSAPGSRLVMTFAHPVGGGGLAGAFVDGGARLAFEALREPLRSSYDDWDITALVTEAGFEDPVVTGASEWARAVGQDAPRLVFAAERLVTAARR